MIDQNGNKIIPKTDVKDTAFMLAEIKFFMKGFRNSSYPEKALRIANAIHSFINNGGSSADITDFLAELEEYASGITDETLSWQLAYIRRSIMMQLEMNGGSISDIAENAVIHAEHFEAICSAVPSAHNRACRVHAYASASDYCTRAMQKGRGRKLRAYARKLFEQLEKDNTSIYHTAGRFLYFCIYVHNYDPYNFSDARFKTLKKALKHARELYMIEHSVESLKFYAEKYILYMGYDQFSFKSEEKNILTLIEWLDSVEDAPTYIRGSRRKLKYALRNFRKSSEEQ